jgi:putative ABC transport system permease protein
MKDRRQGKRTAMFLRMLFRAAILKKRTALSALLAIVVAAAASTAMLNLFVDIQAKLRKEFRGFGANIVVEANSGESFSPADLQKINAAVGNRGIAVPFAYGVAHTVLGVSVVVGGTDFDLVRKLNPWWGLKSWPTKSQGAVKFWPPPGITPVLVGVRAQQVIPSDYTFTLLYKSHSINLLEAGRLHTGGDDDSRMYISLPEFEAWTGLQPSVVEIAAYGSPAEITSLLSQLQKNFPDVDVHAVRQVTEGEANILGKTRSTLLWSSVFIISTAALCVLATLTGWLFDRRRDFAIMKAIGASDRMIALFISGEAAALACVGALIGFFMGIGIAAWIGRANFHAPVSARFDVLPPVLIGCLAITLVATLLPLRLLRQIQPAMILRGE